jgi:hypothetical protein
MAFALIRNSNQLAICKKTEAANILFREALSLFNYGGDARTKNIPRNLGAFLILLIVR